MNRLIVFLCIICTVFAQTLYSDTPNILYKTPQAALKELKENGAGSSVSAPSLRVLHVYNKNTAESISEEQRTAFRKAAELIQPFAQIFEIDLSSEGGDALASELKLERSTANAIFFSSHAKVPPVKYSDDLNNYGVIAAKALASRLEADKIVKNLAEAQAKKAAKPSSTSSSSSSASASSTSSGSASAGSTADDLSDLTFAEAPGKVVDLDDFSFDKQLMKSADGWFVSFTAPWCGYCKQLKPEFSEAASKMKGKIWFANVDCTTNQSICQRFGVRGYPTIKFFRGGRKARNSQGIDYSDARNAQAMANFAESEYKRHSPKPGVTELKTQQHLNECLKGRLCIVAVLPRSGAERKTHLEVLKSSMLDLQRLPRRQFKWLWTTQGAFPALEEAIGLNEKTPTPNLAIVNPKRQGRVALLVEEGSSSIPNYTQAVLRDFIDQILSGSRNTKPMAKKPSDIKVNGSASSSSSSRSEL